jgi:hypothetical protein
MDGTSSLLTLYSTTASGEIPTEGPPPARLQFLLLNSAFLTRASMETMDMARRMFYTLPLRVARLFLERLVLIGRLQTVLTSLRA